MNIKFYTEEYKRIVAGLKAKTLSPGQARSQAVYNLYKIGKDYHKIGPSHYDKLLSHFTTLASYYPDPSPT